MKATMLRLLFVCIFVIRKCHAGDPSAAAFRIFSLPDFSMRLVVNETDASLNDIQWPLVVATNLHLTSYMEMLFAGDGSSQIDRNALKISLNPTIQVDDERTASMFPTATTINATFEGEVYFNNNDQAMMASQSLVNYMVQQAFTGSALANLLDNFKSDDTLGQIIQLQVLVTLPTTDVETTAPHEANGRDDVPSSSSDKSRNDPLKIAAATCVVSFAVFAFVSMFAYLRVRKDGKDCDECSTSDESTDDDASVFSTEYWKDAWAQAAGQVKPKPPRRQRQFKRHPSSVKPNLDSIQEGEEEDDWEETAWDGGMPIHSISTWMAPAVMEPTGDPMAYDDEEMGVASPASSEGSFFRDEDHDIALSKPNNVRSSNKKKERHVSTRCFKRGKEKSGMHKSDDEISVVRNQIMSKMKQSEKAASAPKVDELTAVRNRILAKKQEKEVEEPPLMDELTMVRNRVLSKSSHGKIDVDAII